MRAGVISICHSLSLCLSVSLSLCLSVFVRGGGVVVWCGGRMRACARACGRARWPPASVVVDWRCCLAGVTWRTACDWVHASPAWAMQSRAGPALAAGKWHAQLKLAREAQVARAVSLLHAAQEGWMVHGLQTAFILCKAMQHGAGKMGAVRQC